MFTPLALLGVMSASRVSRDDACALAPVASVAAILTAAVTVARESDAHACAFHTLGGTSVLVTVYTSPTVGAAHANLKRKSEAFSQLLHEPVDRVIGFGDEAAAVLDYLYVRRANVVYTFFISDAPTIADHRMWTERLARLVLENAQAAARRTR